jgi:hypothetical protein
MDLVQPPAAPIPAQEMQAWFRKGEIQGSIRNCEEIFNSGIFSANGIQSPLFQAAVVHLLICLNDLVGKAKADGNRLTTTEDIDIFNEITDLTDLIIKCRNAACHISSTLNNIEENRFIFNVVEGRRPKAFMLDGLELGCDFEDDIAVYYGKYRFYLHRHGRKAFDQIVELYPDVEL